MDERLIKPVDWYKILEKTVWKPLEDMAKNKTIDDFVLDVFANTIIIPMMVTAEYLHQHSINYNEAVEKAKAISNKTLEEAIIRRRQYYVPVVNEVLFRTKEYLTDDSSIKGIKQLSDNLNEYQKLELKKINFEKTLPRNEDNSYNFNKFDQSQKREFGRYIMIHALTNERFKRCVSDLLGNTISLTELRDMGYYAQRATIIGRNNARIKNFREQNVRTN